jgi:hypothetical protein
MALLAAGVISYLFRSRPKLHFVSRPTLGTGYFATRRRRARLSPCRFLRCCCCWHWCVKARELRALAPVRGPKLLFAYRTLRMPGRSLRFGYTSRLQNLMGPLTASRMPYVRSGSVDPAQHYRRPSAVARRQRWAVRRPARYLDCQSVVHTPTKLFTGSKSHAVT